MNTAKIVPLRETCQCSPGCTEIVDMPRRHLSTKCYHKINWKKKKARIEKLKEENLELIEKLSTAYNIIAALEAELRSEIDKAHELNKEAWKKHKALLEIEEITRKGL